ncbi:MAG: hypothetical protein WBM17_04090 [Anaerolineales bacterium]
MPAIGSLPEDIDAIFFIPAPLRAADMERPSRAPIRFSTPTGASCPNTPSVFVSVASGLVKVENPSTRLARHTFQGVQPADLPIETADFLAPLTPKTAQVFGLIILDDLPGRADTITR